MAYVNFTLKDRPVPASDFTDGGYIIRASIPHKWLLEGANESDYYKLLSRCCENILARMPSQEADRIGAAINQAKWTFLFDDHGQFIHH